LLRNMKYDLDVIEATCLKYRLKYVRISNFEMEVHVAPESILVFANTEDGSDTYLGFRDTPWHSHGMLMLMTGDTTYVEFDPSELLLNLISGQVVVVTQYMKGQLQDKWLAHRDERINFQYFEPEEELRIFRAAERDTVQNGEAITVHGQGPDSHDT